MVTARGKRELERTASWVSVRSGLAWLMGVWLVLTLASVGVQLQSIRAAPALAVREPGALVLLAMVSVGYQAFYALVSLGLVAALLRVTRVPPATRAVTPALVATAAFVLVAVLSFALLLGAGGGSSEGISTKELWVLVASARAAGLVALIVALGRMASALGARVPQSVVGAAFAFVAIDTGSPLWRLLTSATGPQPVNQRAVLLVVQIALAVLVVDVARRVRRAAAGAARDELEVPPGGGAVEPADDTEEPQPDLERSAPRRLPVVVAGSASTRSRNVAALLVFVLLALFPAWDALSTASTVGALSDAVRGAPGTEAPSLALWFAAGALVAALAVRKLMASSPYAARGALGLAVIVTLAYAGPHAHEVALHRSHQVDGWPVCETGLDVDGNLPNIETHYRGPYDGPRLPTGEPCTLAGERRDQHGTVSPRGDFSDGIVQIGTRFPDDRRRILWGALALVLVVGLCGVLVWRAADAPNAPLPLAEPRDLEAPVSETSSEPDDDEGDEDRQDDRR